MPAKPRIGRVLIYDVVARKDVAPLAEPVAWKANWSIRRGERRRRGALRPRPWRDRASRGGRAVGAQWRCEPDRAPARSAHAACQREEQGRQHHPIDCLYDRRKTTGSVAFARAGGACTDTGDAYPIRFPYSPIPQTRDGWTNFQPSSDSRQVHVSPAGSDTNPGTIDRPVRSVAKGISMLRDGCPDWILLERGGDYGAIGAWTKSGRSLREPMVVTCYGTGARPRVGWLSTATGRTVTSVAFVSVDFHVQHRDSTLAGFDASKVDDKHCIDWWSAGDCVHFEDCRMAWGLDGLCVHGRTAFILRRCVIERAWTKKDDKAQGIYVMNSSDGTKPGPAFTIEECVFDHNGWHDQFTSQTSATHMFSHNLYLAEHAGPALVRRCIIARAASIGLQIRPGGVFEDNLLIDNRGAGFIAPMLEHPDLPSILRRNVCVEQNSGIGLGFEVIRTKCAIVEGNLVINKQPGAGEIAGTEREHHDHQTLHRRRCAPRTAAQRENRAEGQHPLAGGHRKFLPVQ